jgi:excisionase family DNA binding protein
MNRRDPGPPAPTTLRATTEASASYLTAAQIAELLQVSAKSVYRWAASDPTFPRLKIGGTVRFPRERLLRWLRDREQGLGQSRMRKLMRSLVDTASNGRAGRASVTIVRAHDP